MPLFRQSVFHVAVVLGLFLGTAVAAHAQTPPCTHYASPTGTGNGLSQSSPFKIANFWPVAGPGKTLCLLDGKYTGSTNMILPTGVNGTASAPITVRALNDGQVLIDGQFTRQPVGLNGNSWFVIEGINAKNGYSSNGAAGAVVGLRNGAANNIIRRVVAWDTNIHLNTSVVTTTYTDGPNLFEDLAAFGVGRKTFSTSQRGNNTTCRRCWFRHEGHINGGPTAFSSYYNSWGFRGENILVTWDYISQPETYHQFDSPTGALNTGFGVPAANPGGGHALGHDRVMVVDTSPLPWCANVVINSALAYIKAGAKYFTVNGTPRTQQGVASAAQANCITLRHIYAIIDPAHAFRNSWRSLHLGGLREDQGGGPATNVSATNITSVHGTVTDITTGNGWTVSGYSHGNTAASVPSAWTATTTGANLCKRWVNGQVTDEPLWPWPMNERIKAATAAAGSYSGTCNTCTGGRFARAATDVTADIEALLGTIPSQCRSGSALPPSPSSLSGDLNSDGSVNALDLQLEVNVILGTETNPTIHSRSDLNGDGAVNALDLQRLVNLILGL